MLFSEYRAGFVAKAFGSGKSPYDHAPMKRRKTRREAAFSSNYFEVIPMRF